MTVRFLVAVAAAGLATAVLAETDSRPGPEDPALAVPPIEWRSAFEGYQGQADVPVAGWREVNDAVKEAGGHVGILRAEQATKRAEPPGVPAGHGHKGAGHGAHK